MSDSECVQYENPTTDLICILLETPFSEWRDEHKSDLLLNCVRPQPFLSLSKPCGDKNNSQSKTFIRKFKTSWYLEHKWLCGSTYLQKLFCWPCLLLGVKQGTWNTSGFEDLNNITRSLRKHESSVDHLKCFIRLKEKQKCGNNSDEFIDDVRLQTIKYNENVRRNRLFMQYPIRAALFFCKEEVTLTENGVEEEEQEDSSDKNCCFRQLLDAFIEGSPLEIQNLYSKIKTVFPGNSRIIQNEITDCISGFINFHIHKEINNTEFYAVEVYDVSDITSKVNCPVVLRYVDPNGLLVERFLGFLNDHPERSSESIFNVLSTILQPFDYQKKLVGQYYDGGVLMFASSGQLTELRKKVKECSPQALFVHSTAHHLNLILEQSTNKIFKCCIFFSNINSLSNFFKNLTQRNFFQISEDGRSIPLGTDPRWSSMSKTLSLIVEEWDGLKQVFQNILTTGDRPLILQVKGFLDFFNDFEFTFFTVTFKEIFEMTHILFDILQKKSLDMRFCVSRINFTKKVLNNKRSDETFKRLFIASRVKTRLPSKITSLVDEEQYFSNMKLLFFKILDTILAEIDERFQDLDNMMFLRLGDTSKFEEFSNQFPTDALNNLKEYYTEIFPEIDKLKNELHLIYSDVNYKNLKLDKLIRKLKENNMDDIFQDSYRLFRLILTLPSTTIIENSNVCCLNQIRNCLRNKAGCRQVNLATQINITIHKEFLKVLMETQPFYEDIIDSFAANQRIDLLYK